MSVPTTQSHLALKNPLLAELRGYWRELCNGERIPKWSSFDLLHMPDLVPHYAIVDVFLDPIRFQYKYIGSEIITLAGRDATGAWLDEILYPTTLETIIWPYLYVTEHHEPVATSGPVEFVDKGWNMIEHLFVPFADDNDILSKVLCCWLILDGAKVSSEHTTLDWEAD